MAVEKGLRRLRRIGFDEARVQLPNIGSEGRPGMFAVEAYAAVRRFIFVEGKSRREAARFFGLSREAIARRPAPARFERMSAASRMIRIITPKASHFLATY